MKKISKEFSRIFLKKISKTLSLILSLTILFGLNSCYTRDRLTVRTDYFSRDDLASYWAGTPDPNLNNPPYGQRLIISWTVLKGFRGYIDVIMRFRDREEVSIKIPVKKSRGSYTYSLMNDNYSLHGGILTYRVQLLDESDCILEDWKHQLWVDLIHINEDEWVEESEAVEGV